MYAYYYVCLRIYSARVKPSEIQTIELHPTLIMIPILIIIILMMIRIMIILMIVMIVMLLRQRPVQHLGIYVYTNYDIA